MVDDSVSRRAYLAASATGIAFLAGCPGGGGSGTDTPTDADGGPDASADAGQGSGTDADQSVVDEQPNDGGTDTDRADGMTADGTDADEQSGTDGTDAAEQSGTDGTDADGTDVEPEPAETGQGVLVDQVGYRPNDPKMAVVRTAAESFSVVDADSGETVASGDLTDPVEDPNSGDTVRHADFSGVSEAGTYRLSVGNGAAESYEFAVSGGVWGRTLAEIGRRYTLRRANVAIDDPVTGLSWGVGYPQDAEAVMYFGDEFHEKGETLDMTGGWYDAGDYGKYVTPGAITVAQLLLAYERNPDTFESGQLSIPDGLAGAGGSMPDLLAEAKYKLEWLEKMQRPDGALYHKVSGKSWPAMDTRPDGDDQTRYVFGLSTYGTGMVAGAFATAARVYRPFDGAFADRMLEKAELAFEFLEANPEPIFRRDEGQNSGSGGYAKETDRTERFWAAAELLKTTGDARYADYLDSTLSGLFDTTPPSVSWANAHLLGQWAYYTADGDAGAADGAVDAERQSQVADRIVEAADGIVEQVESEGYNVSLTADEYYWSSAKVAVAKGCLCLLATDIESKSAYVNAALDQLHYVLGRTPTAYAYVTGSGEQAPQNPHSRTVVSTGINVPGNLVGGPNANGGDPVLDDYIASEDPPPMKCYVDKTGSYASNEPAIDYAAPVVFALAEFTPAEAIGVE